MAEENFTVLELISQSPTTSVYKAHQNVLGRTVLLKILHKHLLSDKELVARFSREAKACAMLHSENIVQVYDLTEIDGSLSIVMEFIEGHTLADVLSGGIDECTEEFLLKLALSVLNALSYAHERGVIHRDIKPSNILISDNGVIKVTDFGLAAVTDTPSLTIDGSLIGTPAYMSPEQARGEPVDLRTDLFSLGVTLVEVLSGEKIFAGQSYTECIGKIQNFDIDSLDGVATRCSASFFSFLKKLLAPDREHRFRSAREALEALTASGVTSSVIASPLRKKKRMSYLFGAGAAGILMAIVWYFSFAPRIPDGKTGTGSISPPSQNQQPSAMQEAPEAKVRTEKENIEAIPKYRSSTTENLTQSTKQASDSSASVAPGSLATSVVSKVDSGYIAFSCVPWAHVYIDSEYAGMTPVMGSIEVPAGIHTVIFSNPVFAPIVEQVKVKPKLLTNVNGNFYKSSGFLYFSVKPWGKVYVDDQFKETTPSDSAIIVSAGEHRIRIENPYYFSSITKKLTVKPGDTLRLNFNFKSDGTK